ncbi:MAG: site-specific integrase [Vulcanimicrobiaceae bacterium]
MQRRPLPASPDTLALWATAMLSARHKISSVELRITGVVHQHRIAGHPSPLAGGLIRQVINGARRLRRETPNQKRALTTDQLWKISRCIDKSTTAGLRNRAILVFGFAGGFRRSEMAALDVCDLTFVSKGVSVFLRRSKTDQEGRGRYVGIFRGACADTCPVRTLLAWIAVRGEHPGPLFPAVTNRGVITEKRLQPDGMVEVIKRCVRLIGLDAHLYAGHSLRSGYVTTAAENGASAMSIMTQTGHKTVDMVHRYFRPVHAFSSNPLAGKL